MNKSIIFRFLGIIGGALLIAGLFVPYISFFGISETLFDTANETYVPYLLLVFGVLAIGVFTLNKKVELAYMAVGASLTVVTMYTISAIDTFEYLTIGYYLIVLSPVLMLISVLLLDRCNRKNKKALNAVSIEPEVNNNVATPIVDVQPQLQPNEFAQSIMDQPVMKDISNSTNNNENINIENVPNDLSNENNSAIDNLSNGVSNVDSNSNSVAGQSILSVMDQPLINPETPVVEQPVPAPEVVPPVVEQPVPTPEVVPPVVEQPVPTPEVVPPVVEQPAPSQTNDVFNQNPINFN